MPTKLRDELTDMLKRCGLALVLAGFALCIRTALPVKEETPIYQLSAAMVSSTRYGTAPSEAAWRRHHQDLDAHLPFTDFEIARPAVVGTRHNSEATA